MPNSAPYQSESIYKPQAPAAPQNQFAVDKQPDMVITDINNPPTPRYVRGAHNNYPKMMYDHASGRVIIVRDEAQDKAATKRGFKNEPSPKHDYSKIQAGKVAPLKTEAPAAERPMSAEELVALEEADK